MDTIEEELRSLLEGRTLPTTTIDIPAINQDYKPVVRKTVYYVVCAVVVDENGHILMTQEGFHPCREQWYLPAGRVDPGESLMEAARREVKEETGLEFEPTTLLALEASRGDWYRFTFTGKVTGGKLRTLAEQDDETMQAAWCSIQQIQKGASTKNSDFVLRGKDILHLIEIGSTYHDSSPTQRHPDVLPVSVNHQTLSLRPVIMHSDKSTGEVSVLISTQGQPHIPVTEYSPPKTATLDALHSLIQQAFGQYVKISGPGILTVEHTGKPAETSDGLSLSVLVCLQTKDGSRIQTTNDQFSWHVVSDSVLKDSLCSRQEKSMSIPAFCH